METVYLGYIRVSTEEQTKEGYSIAAQRRELDDYAQKRGFDFKEIYVDEGKSSSNLDRPGIQEIIALVSQNKLGKLGYKYRYILCIRTPNRLIRNFVLSRSLNHVFDTYNVEVECLHGKWGTGQSDDIGSDILMLIDENEISRIPRRVADSLRETAIQGNYPYGGKPPFGYDFQRNESGKGRKLVINEKKAVWVRWMYESIAKGLYNENQVLKVLKRDKACNYKWGKVNVSNILRNPIYYGHLITKKGLDIENHSPGIVTKELWEEANRKLDVASREKKYGYLFKGKCWCVDKKEKYPMVCLSTLKKKKRKIRVYLYQYCKEKNRRLNENKIYDEFIDSYACQFNLAFKVSKETLMQAREKLEFQLKDLKKNHEAGFINDDDYSSAHVELLLKLKDNRKKLKRLRKKEPNIKKFNALGFQEKRNYILRYVDRIDVYFFPEGDYGVEIYFKKAHIKAVA